MYNIQVPIATAASSRSQPTPRPAVVPLSLFLFLSPFLSLSLPLSLARSLSFSSKQPRDICVQNAQPILSLFINLGTDSSKTKTNLYPSPPLKPLPPRPSLFPLTPLCPLYPSHCDTSQPGCHGAYHETGRCSSPTTQGCWA